MQSNVMTDSSSFLIAATNSGCGKTTVTIGLLRALKRKGFAVRPYKCGPDYIDTQYHRMASGVDSVNLDSRFTTPEHLREVYAHYSSHVNVVEGVMGLFDGFDRDHGSSAEIASMIHVPVVLVVNARSMAYSAAAMIHGFSSFRNDIKVVGVIFNQVGSERHASFLRQACEDTHIPCLGCIPRIKEMEMPSRHLGLSLENERQMEALITLAADTMEKHVDITRLLSLTSLDSELSSALGNHCLPNDSIPPISLCNLRISVARDEAFNFTYLENIDRLKEMGTVTFFSPIHDEQLPTTDLLYIPGGYPEFFLKELAENTKMKESVRDFIENGGKCLAECGGMMYLCDSIIGIDGISYPMVGILHQTATMQGMRLHLGYRQWDGITTDGTPYSFNGHEFHYSRILENETTVYRHKNLRASYIHLYWGDRNLLELWG